MKIIDSYDIALKQKLIALSELYKKHNQSINVVSRKDIDNILSIHIRHSLIIDKVVNFAAGSVIMDVGTGGGLPGLPLAIVNPDCHFILVDSVGKKIKLIEQIIKELNINNVQLINNRVENLDIKVDYITSRAVAKLSTLLEWTSNVTKPNTKFVALKGGDLQSEISEIANEYKISIINCANIVDDDEWFLNQKFVLIIN